MKVLYEAKADFDADLSKYGIKKGVFINDAEREVYAPVAMWLEAVDLVLQRLKQKNCPFQRIKGISGAGQQHGSVYWSMTGEENLGSLNPEGTLVDQLAKKAFAHPFSPNWQDASTQKECDAFDAELGSPEKLAQVTGSKAHHVSLQPSSYFVHQLTTFSDLLGPRLCVFTRSIQMYILQLHASLWFRRSWRRSSLERLQLSTSVMSVV